MTEEIIRPLYVKHLVTGAVIGGCLTLFARRVLLHFGRIREDLAETNVALRREMKEREKAELALERSESRFRSTFEHAAIGMTVINMQGFVMAANPAFSEFTGYTLEELPGMNVQDYAYPEDLAHGNELLFDMIDGKIDSYQVEKRYVKKDGCVIWGRLTASIARNPEPEPPFIIGMIEDVTERKLAEERERELEAEKLEFYRRTIIAATDGKLVITDTVELEKLAGPAKFQWEINDASDVPKTKDKVLDIANSAGMNEDKAWNLVTCAGELVSNAIKHAGGGVASVHSLDDSLLLIVADKGPGIPSLTLPDVALRTGYSTAGTLGMGYKLMISLSDRVYLATGPSGTTAAIEMKLQTTEPAFDEDNILGLPNH